MPPIADVLQAYLRLRPAMDRIEAAGRMSVALRLDAELMPSKFKVDRELWPDWCMEAEHLGLSPGQLCSAVCAAIVADVETVGKLN